MTFARLYDNNPKYILRRTLLRRNQTTAEKILWKELQGKKMLGYKFRRQYNIDDYIVDFFCHELRLIIELDGPIHEQQQAYDKKREEALKKKGYRLIRFFNDQVLFERESALVVIVQKIKEIEAPPLVGEVGRG